jgi:hypothetical protein
MPVVRQGLAGGILDDNVSGFLNEGLRDWIALGGIALALLQTWLAVKAVVGTKSSHDGVKKARVTLGPDGRNTYPKPAGWSAADDEERLLREYGAFGVFSLVGSSIGLAAGVVITYAVIRGYLTLSTGAFDSLLTVCMAVVVGGAIFGAYGVWNWSKGRSASKHLLVMSLVRAGVIGLTITTAGVVWWCLGQNSNLVVVRALWQFVVAAFLLLLASAMVFVGPKK